MIGGFKEAQDDNNKSEKIKDERERAKKYKNRDILYKIKDQINQIIKRQKKSKDLNINSHLKNINKIVITNINETPTDLIDCSHFNSKKEIDKYKYNIMVNGRNRMNSIEAEELNKDLLIITTPHNPLSKINQISNINMDSFYTGPNLNNKITFRKNKFIDKNIEKNRIPNLHKGNFSKETKLLKNINEENFSSYSFDKRYLNNSGDIKDNDSLFIVNNKEKFIDVNNNSKQREKNKLNISKHCKSYDLKHLKNLQNFNCSSQNIEKSRKEKIDEINEILIEPRHKDQHFNTIETTPKEINNETIDSCSKSQKNEIFEQSLKKTINKKDSIKEEDKNKKEINQISEDNSSNKLNLISDKDNKRKRIKINMMDNNSKRKAIVYIKPISILKVDLEEEEESEGTSSAEMTQSPIINPAYSTPFSDILEDKGKETLKNSQYSIQTSSIQFSQITSDGEMEISNKESNKNNKQPYTNKTKSTKNIINSNNPKNEIDKPEIVCKRNILNSKEEEKITLKTKKYLNRSRIGNKREIKLIDNDSDTELILSKNSNNNSSSKMNIIFNRNKINPSLEIKINIKNKNPYPNNKISDKKGERNTSLTEEGLTNSGDEKRSDKAIDPASLAYFKKEVSIENNDKNDHNFQINSKKKKKNKLLCPVLSKNIEFHSPADHKFSLNKKTEKISELKEKDKDKENEMKNVPKCFKVQSKIFKEALEKKDKKLKKEGISCQTRRPR
jgi:hypothetical protein